ncbi:MAG: PilN domain-containing protein [Nitrospirae bacterium]|nr:PilN domain-containing protein [Candidatus Troglogloeales bacterium]MBI3598272.1 PilN domain-containing protein [Candidatus Troglogloeales bacterium]
MKFHVNLATKDSQRNKIVQISLYLLLALLVLLFIWNFNGYIMARERISLLNTNVRQVQEKSKKLGSGFASKDVLSILTKEVSFVNGLLEKRAFSWTLFLSKLEEAVPSNISVTKLEPDFKDGQITVSGKALSLQDLTKLIIRIEDSPDFEDLFLVNQKESPVGGVVDFVLHFKYRFTKEGEHS